MASILRRDEEDRHTDMGSGRRGATCHMKVKVEYRVLQSQAKNHQKLEEAGRILVSNGPL